MLRSLFSTHIPTHGWLILLCGWFCLLSPATASAKDVRLALLVGNEYGWKKDPKLQYALKGDLRPMASTLRRIGFQTKLLENPSPQKMRQMFAWLRRRLKRTPQVTTFVFYYTGHADKTFLHQGPKTKRPVSYRELVTLFKSLQVRRRFVFLDSCFSGELIRKFGSLSRYKELVPKGARARRMIDLSRSINNQGNGQSLQIISSGVALSWESKRYKASIFTHHLLKGLKGRADRDIDGKISVSELFDYVSQEMKRDIHQTPQLFGVVRRSESYALAPAYSSRLWIGPQVLGDLRVSVANFSWRWKKRQRHALRLALIHGSGTVELVKGKRCMQQRLALPKGGEIRLSNEWSKIPCRKAAFRSKGQIQLDSILPPPPPLTKWSMDVQAGAQFMNIAQRDLLFTGGQIGVTYDWLRLQFGTYGTSTPTANLKDEHQHILIDIQLAAGWHPQWDAFALFLGASASLGFWMQNVNIPESMGTGTTFRAAFVVRPTWWLARHWGLTLHLDAGVTFGRFRSNEISVSPAGSALFGLQYRF
ncbi:MAG: hypothetical protein CL920_32005 [Deltaproteobacteria bacterium]|nr:hypothetical protein [Deltaproteobacteria bacterium]MBU53345.1 hypothetical protein [Deltaproteobacteria bacterium]|tara:strand:- start:3555 stop:5156 length:1602 start_codon:yes stop_codon:yes gene_type:complete